MVSFRAIEAGARLSRDTEPGGRVRDRKALLIDHGADHSHPHRLDLSFELAKCLCRTQSDIPATAADQVVHNLANRPARESGLPRSMERAHRGLYRLARSPTRVRHPLNGSHEPVFCHEPPVTDDPDHKYGGAGRTNDVEPNRRESPFAGAGLVLPAGRLKSVVYRNGGCGGDADKSNDLPAVRRIRSRSTASERATTVTSVCSETID